MRTTALLSFCLVVAASLSCCSSPETDSAHRDLVLRLYEVPHGLASDIRSVLRETLRATEGYEQRGTVSVAPGGKLLVLAEPQVQAGIENLIGSLEDAAPPTPSPTLEMSYWLVAGRSVSETVAVSSTIPPELASALGSVVDALGPMEFALIERVQLAARSDSRATVNGSFVTIHQTASLVEGRVVARLEISSSRGNRLATEVYLEPDQMVVLAQTNIGEPGRMPDFFSDREGSQQPNVLIYVVRATVQG